MSRSDRAAGAGNDRRTALLGLMVVALTGSLLVLAGTGPAATGRHDRVARVSLSQRVFSCTGGLPGTVATSGSVLGGLSAPRPVGRTPVQVQMDLRVARGAFAGQQQHRGKGLAWLPCPEAQARWWFVGAGGGVTHDSVLTISNPRPGAAIVDVDVYGPLGAVQAPGLHGLTVGPGQSRTVDLAASAPALGDLAVSVVAQRGLVAVSAADRYSPGVVGRTVDEWVPPQPDPALTTTLAGLPDKAEAATLIVVNPGQAEAVVQVRVIGSGGTFTPQGVASLTIPPASTARLPITSVLDGSPVAVQVLAQQPVTATIRTTRSKDIAYATGVRPIRGATAFAVPQGTGRLVLSALTGAGSVVVAAFDASGRHVFERTVTVPAHSSVGVLLGSSVRYLRLASDGVPVVAGFAITGSARVPGIAGAGVAPAIRSIRLPVVLPGW